MVFRVPFFDVTNLENFRRELRRAFESVVLELESIKRVLVSPVVTGAKYSASFGEVVRLDPPAGGVTVILPPLNLGRTGKGIRLIVVGSDGAVTLEPIDSTINGAETHTFVAGVGAINVVCDGDRGWFTPGAELTDSVYTAGDGLDLTGSAFSVDVSDFAGAGLEDDGSENLRIAAAAAGDGLTGGGGAALSVSASALAGSGLEDDGSNNLRLASVADNTFLGVVAGPAVPTALPMSGFAGDGLDFNASSHVYQVDVSDFAGAGLEDDGSENLRIAAAAAGSGLTGGGGSALAVGAGDGIDVAADSVAVDVSDFAGTHLTDDGSNNLTLSNVSAGTVKGRQLDGGTGAVVDLTGLEVGELVRFGQNEQNDLAAATHDDLAVDELTNSLRVGGGNAAIVTGFSYDDGNSGHVCDVVKQGGTGSLRLNHEDAGSSSNNRIQGISGEDILLNSSNECVRTHYIGGRHNVVGGIFYPFFNTPSANNRDIIIHDGTNYNRENLQSAVFVLRGSGSPEGSVTANPGTLYLNSGGGTGTTLFVKETGTGNTGWVAK